MHDGEVTMFFDRSVCNAPQSGSGDIDHIPRMEKKTTVEIPRGTETVTMISARFVFLRFCIRRHEEERCMHVTTRPCASRVIICRATRRVARCQGR